MAGFMSGFGTTLAQLIEDDRKYYRDAAAKRRDYIQTYGTRAVMEREDKANAALGVANTLMNRGFSKDYVTSIAANNGVRSMVDFADQISKRTDLTEKDIKEIEASAKDFVKDNPDEDLSTVVKRAYGLYKSTKDPVARKRNIFGAMLGLDASMMEDDVLNDMYIDGYTGSDIYRIMGSAGPGAGKPMGVKLPPKARGYKENLAYRAAISQEADNFITYELEELGQRIDKDPDSEVKQTLQGVRTELLRIQKDLKTDPSGAMAEYLGMPGLSYNSSLLATIQQTEDAYAGSITSNPLLTDKFKTTYGQLVGDIKDDEAAAAEDTTKAPEQQEPKGDGITSTDIKTDIFTYETAEELNAAVESGKVIPGVTPVRKGQDGPVMMVPKTTDLGDMTGAPGFRERDDIPQPSDFIEKAASRKYGREGDIAGYKAMYDTIMTLPEEDRSSYVEAFESIEDMPELSEVVQDVTKDVPGFVDNVVGKGAGAVGMGGLLFYKGMAYADAFITGDKARVAEKLIKADDAMERAKEVFSEGIVKYLQEKADEAGMQGGFSKARGEQLKKALAKETNIISAIGNRLKDAADVWRSGDVFASRAAQVETESDPAVLSGVFDTKGGVPSRSDIDKLKTVLELNQVTLPEKVTKEDVAEEAKVDEIIVANLDTSQTATRGDFDKIKTILEQEQLIDTSTDELYRGPISGKTLVEKLDDIYNFYTQEEPEYNPRTVGTVGFRDLGLRDTTDDVRERQNQPPELQMSAARSPSPEADQQDFDSPRNLAVENFTTRGINATPRGLMTPRKEFAPKLGQAQFGDLIDRVHGSSKAAEAFNNKVSSGKVTAADVTRLIKATRKLPKTTSRGTLLDSLFDLRDALNNR